MSFSKFALSFFPWQQLIIEGAKNAPIAAQVGGAVIAGAAAHGAVDLTLRGVDAARTYRHEGKTFEYEGQTLTVVARKGGDLVTVDDDGTVVTLRGDDVPRELAGERDAKAAAEGRKALGEVMKTSTGTRQYSRVIEEDAERATATARIAAAEAKEKEALASLGEAFLRGKAEAEKELEDNVVLEFPEDNVDKDVEVVVPANKAAKAKVAEAKAKLAKAKEMSERTDALAKAVEAVKSAETPEDALAAAEAALESANEEGDEEAKEASEPASEEAGDEEDTEASSDTVATPAPAPEASDEAPGNAEAGEEAAG